MIVRYTVSGRDYTGLPLYPKHFWGLKRVFFFSLFIFFIFFTEGLRAHNIYNWAAFTHAVCCFGYVFVNKEKCQTSFENY